MTPSAQDGLGDRGLSRRSTIGFLLVNLGLRAWSLAMEHGGLTLESLSHNDERTYLRAARAFLDQGWAWLASEKALEAPPGEVFFLALTGGWIGLAKALTILASALTLLRSEERRVGKECRL